MKNDATSDTAQSKLCFLDRLVVAFRQVIRKKGGYANKTNESLNTATGDLRYLITTEKHGNSHSKCSKNMIREAK